MRGHEIVFPGGSNIPPQNNMILANPDNIEANPSDDLIVNCEKKIVRRDNERQRRQLTAALNASLRSILPHEFVKGKRSISDHINEAVNYINHLKEKIHELNAKRDKIIKFGPDLMINSSSSSLSSSSSNKVNIMVGATCLGGVEVVVVSGGGTEEEGVALSGVLRVLLDEGLGVVECASTRINQRLYHTIQCEVDDLSYFDFLKLEMKLNFCHNSDG